MKIEEGSVRIKKKKVRSFTLIELLAGIIILAEIALIATPIILNVVEAAKKRANYLTAQGLLEGARLYYIDSVINGYSTLTGITNAKAIVGYDLGYLLVLTNDNEVYQYDCPTRSTSCTGSKLEGFH